MLLFRTAANGVGYYFSPVLEQTGVLHAFSTRLGGASGGPFASLNLGNPAGAIQDDPANIEENYRRLQTAIGCANRERCRVHQVHGAMVRAATRGEMFENGAEADAIVSDDPARVLSVRVADCTPVLLATEDGRAVAAVHAGWRGVVAGIAPAAAMELVKMSACPPASLRAAIGPCIGQQAFEVGPEVLAEFQRVFPEAEGAPWVQRADGKGHVDLRGAIRRQLIKLGLSPELIDMTDRCTFQHGEEFYSHRRDRGTTGRMAAIIGATTR